MAAIWVKIFLPVLSCRICFTRGNRAFCVSSEQSEQPIDAVLDQEIQDRDDDAEDNRYSRNRAGLLNQIFSGWPDDLMPFSLDTIPPGPGF